MTSNLRRKQRGAKQKNKKRSVVVSVRELKSQVLLEYNTESGIEPINRPKTRADCVRGIRPCPYVSCKYHLYLEVRKTGSIEFFYPDTDLAEMSAPTCALDVAEGGARTLLKIGKMFGVSRERIRQIEQRVVRKLKMIE